MEKAIRKASYAVISVAPAPVKKFPKPARPISKTHLRSVARPQPRSPIVHGYAGLKMHSATERRNASNSRARISGTCTNLFCGPQRNTSKKSAASRLLQTRARSAWTPPCPCCKFKAPCPMSFFAYWPAPLCAAARCRGSCCCFSAQIWPFHTGMRRCVRRSKKTSCFPRHPPPLRMRRCAGTVRAASAMGSFCALFRTRRARR